MFFLGSAAGLTQSLQSALLLTLTILLGLGMTFLVSRLLSATVLKGVPSSFTLELPPYRRPQLGKVLVRSVFDRTLFVLGRAITVAAPAGILLWVMANVGVQDQSLLAWASGFLDPLGRFMGLDGVILIAFILGFPANEIVIPIIIMAYMANGSLIEMSSLSAMKDLFLAQGWTLTTAVCTLIFVLFHWPCSTTCLTIYKETKSIQWTAAAILDPDGLRHRLLQPGSVYPTDVLSLVGQSQRLAKECRKSFQVHESAQCFFLPSLWERPARSFSFSFYSVSGRFLPSRKNRINAVFQRPDRTVRNGEG